MITARALASAQIATTRARDLRKRCGVPSIETVIRCIAIR